MILEPQSIKILKINKRAGDIRAIRLDKGSPSFDFELNVDTKSLVKRILRMVSSYPSEEGYPELIKLIQEIESKINHRDVNANNICLTNGALSGLFFAFASLFDKKDIVLINELSFEGFTSVLSTLGLIPKVVNYDNFEAIEKIVKESNIKAVILNSPENPSGKMYKEEFLEFINSLAKKYNPLVVSDEVNNQNVYPPYKFISPSNFINSDRLISVNSFSKNYFLPGVRLGWVIAREEITKKIKNAMAVSQVSINCPSQVIAYSIVENCKEELTLFKKELQDKKNEGEKILKENDISCLQPVTGGTVFFIETEVNSEKLVNHLLNYCKVGAIPGIYFGEKWKNWLRVGFGAVSSSDFKKAISSIKQATYDCK